MEEQALRIKSYNSESFLRINSMTRYTNDLIDGRHVLFDAPQSTDYHLYFVSHGPLTIKNNNKAYDMEEFDLLIYQPEGKQELTSLHMASYVHCIFSGKSAEEILNDLNLKKNVIYHVTPSYKSGEHYMFYNKQIEYVRSEFKKHKKYSELSSACMLIEFLSLYSRNCVENSEDSALKQIKQVVSAILESVAKNEGKTFNVEKLIKNTHLSKSQFYRLFKEYTGTSPLRFFTNCRLTAAADYLVIYNMKIRDVSERLGFEDPLYFSRLFKKEFGVSPKTYVKLHKTHSHIQDDEN